jgi:hypothetical protein
VCSYSRTCTVVSRNCVCLAFCCKDVARRCLHQTQRTVTLSRPRVFPLMNISTDRNKLTDNVNSGMERYSPRLTRTAKTLTPRVRCLFYEITLLRNRVDRVYNARF